MAAKQAQAKRTGKSIPISRWLKPLLAALTVTGSVVGLGAMLNWMQDPYQWPVRTVQIEGRFRHLQQDQLQAEVAPLAGDGFFALRVDEIQARIEALPWVDQVSVRRVWPDRLLLQVLEQQPVARWGERGFINARAQMFEPQQTVELPELPNFQGPEGHEKRVLAMYQRMQELLQPLQLGVSSLRLDARRTWRVQLSNGLSVEVGRNDPVERVARFVRVYPAILAAANGTVKSVDLRYSNGFTVRWQQIRNEAKSTG